VTPAVRQLLAYLSEARKVSSLATALSGIEGLDLDRDLAFVRERGLLFEEDGKALSLVLPRKPPQMTYRANALGVRKKLKPEAALAPAIAAIPRTARRVVKPGSRMGA
jgi:hypothetical protein